MGMILPSVLVLLSHGLFFHWATMGRWNLGLQEVSETIIFFLLISALIGFWGAARLVKAKRLKLENTVIVAIIMFAVSIYCILKGKTFPVRYDHIMVIAFMQAVLFGLQVGVIYKTSGKEN